MNPSEQLEPLLAQQRAEIESLHAQAETLRQQLLSAQVHIAQMEVALDHLLVDCALSDECRYGTLSTSHVQRICEAALPNTATPADLDALLEHEAQVLEAAAEVLLTLPRMTGGTILPEAAASCLREYLAPKHRAKKGKTTVERLRPDYWIMLSYGGNKL